MHQKSIDPSPRSYAPFVYLMDRTKRGAECAPKTQTLSDITEWLLFEAVKIDNLMFMYEEFLWRCRAAGIPVDRSSLHVGTLHPRIIGFSWVWNSTDEICDEVTADARAMEIPAFTKNPLARVMGGGPMMQLDLRREKDRNAFPLMLELADEGYTEYAIMPLYTATERKNAITFASKHPDGFPDAIREDTKTIMDIFALHVERHILQRIARNVVDTYLGPIAGERVLNGEIKRGDGEAIDAVVWMSDLRGFTTLSDKLEGPEVSTVLNTYFEVVSKAVLEQGGDILKFIGDGVLAVFPKGGDAEANAAERALLAAQNALQELDAVNEKPPEELKQITGWHPLKVGVALHEGEVFFGNIGGASRLDFTVIGRAVNETSRVEALCKELKRPLLLTEPVYENLTASTKAKLDLMGEFHLRGVSRDIPVYACASTRQR